MKKLIGVVAFLLAVVLLGTVSCGQAEQAETEEEGVVRVSKGLSVGSAPGESVMWEEEVTVEAARPVVVEDYGSGSSQGMEIDRMVVRTGDMALVVEDVTAAIDQITMMAETFDGYVVSSRMWKEGERLAGSISIRVLAEYFDDAVRALRAMATDVIYENATSKDVTEEYVDLSSSLENLEATEQQLLAIMEKASTVEDILDVQKELSRVRGEIEQTKGRMQYLEQTSSTSLIQVQLTQSSLNIEFSADKRRGLREGEKVRFTVGSITSGFPPYSYEWDFGDGEISTDENPTHAYKDDGYYTVSLTVTDDRGNTDTVIREAYIYVQPGWSAGSIARTAWNGLVIFGHVLGNILIWLGIFSPVWIVIGGLFYWRIRRRRKRTHE